MDFSTIEYTPHYSHISPIGVLLPELVTSLVLLQLHVPTVLHASNAIVMLQTLLDLLDKFNKLAPGLVREEMDDLSWPDVWGKTRHVLSSQFIHLS